MYRAVVQVEFISHSPLDDISDLSGLTKRLLDCENCGPVCVSAETVKSETVTPSEVVAIAERVDTSLDYIFGPGGWRYALRVGDMVRINGSERRTRIQEIIHIDLDDVNINGKLMKYAALSE